MHARTFGASLLVAGTAIGGGMLALPIFTGGGGFLPSVIMYTLCCFLMMSTGLLYTEMYLWHSQDVNMISMAKHTLGSKGSLIVWAVYLFLFYSLCIAYIAGGGQIVDHMVGRTPIGAPLFVLLVGGCIVFGTALVDRINRICVFILLVCFICFIIMGITQIHPPLLLETYWSQSWGGLPLIALSFGFQGTVPTLVRYLRRDPQEVQKAIFIGGGLTLIVYLLWQTIILGIIPKPVLALARDQGWSAVVPLKELLHMPWLSSVGEGFALFAIITSFFGVGLGLIDFLADGCGLKKNIRIRMLLAALCFLPAMIWSMLDPTLFLHALEYGGGIGGILLLVLFPTWMVWRGRYRHHHTGSFRVFGGKRLLIALFLFSGAVLGVILLQGLRSWFN